VINALDNCYKKLEHVTSTLANYLYDNQVNIHDIVINPIREKKVFIEHLKPLNSNLKVHWSFKQEDGCWYYRNNDWHLITEQSLIRLPVYDVENPQNDACEQIGLHQSNQQKFAKYLRADIFLRVRGYLRKKIHLLRFGHKKSPHTKSSSVDLIHHGGVTFEVMEISDGGSLILNCLDYGGIYAHDLNSEGKWLPDQVPVSYYATEYAAYVFWAQYKCTREEKWLDAVEASMKHFLLNYQPYTTIAFDHFEFKIMPLALLVAELQEQQILTELSYSIQSLLSNDWHTYSPVNVYALRLSNIYLLERLGVPSSNSVSNICLKMLEDNQSISGLIEDNNSGARIDNCDFTYHQYSLACLSLASDMTDNPRISALLEKGLDFSDYIKLGDGHVSYYGRGSNNIYHLAAYAYAASTTGNGAKKVEDILELLLPYLTKNSGLPTALNTGIKSRMAWNHCSVPYNAMTAFFLTLCMKRLRNNKIPQQVPQRGHHNLKSADVFRLESNYGIAIFTKGSDIFTWSDGAQRVGLGGLCGFSIGNINILLSLGYSSADDTWTSDFPLDWMKVKSNSLCGKLIQVNNKVIFSNAYIRAEYTLHSNSMVFSYDIDPQFEEAGLVGSFHVPTEKMKSYELRADSVIITLKNDVVLIAKFRQSPGSIKLQKITSNPMGPGLRFELHNPNCGSHREWELLYDTTNI
jgi:hypothetical protein